MSTTPTTNIIDLKAAAVAVAKTQIGVTENPKGSNSGKEVEAYLKSVGLGKGYAWCQAFVYWVYQQAAAVAHTANPVVKTAGVLNCLNGTKTTNVITVAQALKNPNLLAPGQQFIMDFGKGVGHTGIIKDYVVNNGTIVLHTIEGNTNDDGSREGYEVAERQRNINTIKAIINY